MGITIKNNKKLVGNQKQAKMSDIQLKKTNALVLDPSQSHPLEITLNKLKQAQSTQIYLAGELIAEATNQHGDLRLNIVSEHTYKIIADDKFDSCTLIANGDIQLSGIFHDLTVQCKNAIIDEPLRGEKINITTQEKITAKAVLNAADITLSAQQVISEKRVRGDWIKISAQDNFINKGNIATQYELEVNAKQINNTGMLASKVLKIEGQAEVKNTGNMTAITALKVRTPKLEDHGKIRSRGKMSIIADNVQIDKNAELKSATKFKFIGTEINNAGQIASDGLTFVSAESFKSAGSVKFSDQTYLHAKSLVISEDGTLGWTNKYVDGNGFRAFNIDCLTKFNPTSVVSLAGTKLMTDVFNGAGSLEMSNTQLDTNHALLGGDTEINASEITAKGKTLIRGSVHSKDSTMRSATFFTEGNNVFKTENSKIFSHVFTQQGAVNFTRSEIDSQFYLQKNLAIFNQSKLTVNNQFQQDAHQNLQLDNQSEGLLKDFNINGGVTCNENSKLSVEHTNLFGELHIKGSALSSNTLVSKKNSKLTTVGSHCQVDEECHLQGETQFSESSLKFKALNNSGQANIKDSTVVAHGPVKSNGNLTVENSRMSLTENMTLAGTHTLINSNITADSVYDNAKGRMQHLQVNANHLEFGPASQVNVSSESILNTKFAELSGTTQFDSSILLARAIMQRGGRVDLDNRSRFFVEKSMHADKNSEFNLLHDSIIVKKGDEECIGEFEGKVKVEQSKLVLDSLLLENKSTVAQSNLHIKNNLYLDNAEVQSSQTESHSLFTKEKLILTKNSQVTAEHAAILSQANVNINQSTINLSNKFDVLGNLSIERAAIMAHDLTIYEKFKSQQSRVLVENDINAGTRSTVESESSHVSANNICIENEFSSKKSQLTAKTNFNFGYEAKSKAEETNIEAKREININSRHKFTGKKLSLKSDALHNQSHIQVDGLQVDVESLENTMGIIDGGSELKIDANKYLYNFLGRIRADTTTITAGMSINMAGDIVGHDNLTMNSALNLNLCGAQRSYNANINSLLSLNTGLVLPAMPSSPKAFFSAQHVINFSRMTLTNLFPKASNSINLAYQIAPIALPYAARVGKGIFQLGSNLCGLVRNKNPDWNNLIPNEVTEVREFCKLSKEKKKKWFFSKLPTGEFPRIKDVLPTLLKAKSVLMTGYNFCNSSASMSGEFKNLSFSSLSEQLHNFGPSSLLNIAGTAFGPTLHQESLLDANAGIRASHNVMQNDWFSANTGTDYGLNSLTHNGYWMYNAGTCAGGQVNLTGHRLENTGHISNRNKMYMHFDSINNGVGASLEGTKAFIQGNKFKNAGTLDLSKESQLDIKEIDNAGKSNLSETKVNCDYYKNSGTTEMNQSHLTTNKAFVAEEGSNFKAAQTTAKLNAMEVNGYVEFKKEQGASKTQEKPPEENKSNSSDNENKDKKIDLDVEEAIHIGKEGKLLLDGMSAKANAITNEGEAAFVRSQVATELYTNANKTTLASSHLTANQAFTSQENSDLKGVDSTAYFGRMQIDGAVELKKNKSSHSESSQTDDNVNKTSDTSATHDLEVKHDITLGKNGKLTLEGMNVKADEINNAGTAKYVESNILAQQYNNQNLTVMEKGHLTAAAEFNSAKGSTFKAFEATAELGSMNIEGSVEFKKQKTATGESQPELTSSAQQDTSKAADLDVKQNINIGAEGKLALEGMNVKAKEVNNNGTAQYDGCHIEAERYNNRNNTSMHQSHLTTELEFNAMKGSQFKATESTARMTDMNVDGLVKFTKDTPKDPINSGEAPSNNHEAVHKVDLDVQEKIAIGENGQLVLEGMHTKAKVIENSGQAQFKESEINTDKYINAKSTVLEKSHLKIKDEFSAKENSDMVGTNSTMKAGSMQVDGLVHLSKDKPNPSSPEQSDNHTEQAPTKDKKYDLEIEKGINISKTGELILENIDAKCQDLNLLGKEKLDGVQIDVQRHANIAEGNKLNAKNTTINAETIHHAGKTEYSEHLGLHANQKLSSAESSSLATQEKNGKNLLEMTAATGDLHGAMDVDKIKLDIKNLPGAEQLIARKGQYARFQVSDTLGLKTDAEMNLNQTIDRQCGLDLEVRSLRVGVDYHTKHDLHFKSTVGDISLLSSLSGQNIYADSAARLYTTRNIHAQHVVGFNAQQEYFNLGGNILGDIVSCKASAIKNYHVRSQSLAATGLAHLAGDGGGIIGREVYLEATAHNIENHGGILRGTQYLQGIAAADIINNCNIYTKKGKYDTLKEYAAGTISGGTGLDEQHIGLYLKAGNKLYNNASTIHSDAHSYIEARKGLESKALHHSYIKKHKKKRTVTGKKEKIKYNTTIGTSEISAAGQQTISCEEGGIHAVATHFLSGLGTQAYAKNSIELYSLKVTEETMKKETSLWGLNKSKSHEYHDRVAPVIIQDNGITRLVSKEGSIIGRGVVALGAGDFITSAKNGSVAFSSDILHHHVHSKSQGCKISSPTLDLITSTANKGPQGIYSNLDPTVNKVNTLLHSNNPEEAFANSWNAALSTYNSYQVLNYALNSGSFGNLLMERSGITGLLDPSVDLSYTTSEQDFSYETLGPGAVHRRSWIIEAKDEADIKGMDVEVNNMDIKAKTINIKPHELHANTQTSQTTMTVGMAAGGTVKTSASHTSSQSSATHYQSGGFKVHENLHVEADEMNLQTSVETGTITGEVKTLNAESKQDIERSETISASLSSTGQFSAEVSKTKSAKVNQATTLHVREGINHDDAHQFKVTTTNNKGAKITTDGVNKFASETINNEKVIDYVKQSGLAISGNIKDIAQAFGTTEQSVDSTPSSAIHGPNTITTFNVASTEKDFRAEQQATYHGVAETNIKYQNLNGAMNTKNAEGYKIFRDTEKNISLDVPVLNPQTFIQAPRPAEKINSMEFEEAHVENTEPMEITPAEQTPSCVEPLLQEAEPIISTPINSPDSESLANDDGNQNLNSMPLVGTDSSILITEIEDASEQTEIIDTGFNPATHDVRIGSKQGRHGPQDYDIDDGHYINADGVAEKIATQNDEREAGHSMKVTIKYEFLTPENEVYWQTEGQIGDGNNVIRPMLVDDKGQGYFIAEYDAGERQVNIQLDVGRSIKLKVAQGSNDLCDLATCTYAVDAGSISGLMSASISNERNFNAQMSGEIGILGPNAGGSVKTAEICFFGFTLQGEASAQVGVGAKVAAGGGVTLDKTRLQLRPYVKVGGYLGLGAESSLNLNVGIDTDFPQRYANAFDEEAKKSHNQEFRDKVTQYKKAAEEDKPASFFQRCWNQHTQSCMEELLDDQVDRMGRAAVAHSIFAVHRVEDSKLNDPKPTAAPTLPAGYMQNSLFNSSSTQVDTKQNSEILKPN